VRDDHVLQRYAGFSQVIQEFPADKIGGPLLGHLLLTSYSRVDQVPGIIGGPHQHPIPLAHIDDIELQQPLTGERRPGNPSFLLAGFHFHKLSVPVLDSNRVPPKEISNRFIHLVLEGDFELSTNIVDELRIHGQLPPVILPY
jgi:hypothetical protein